MFDGFLKRIPMKDLSKMRFAEDEPMLQEAASRVYKERLKTNAKKKRSSIKKAAKKRIARTIAQQRSRNPSDYFRSYVPTCLCVQCENARLRARG